MEIRLPHYVQDSETLIFVRQIDDDKMAFQVNHSDKVYSTLLHDILFIYGKVERTVSRLFIYSFYSDPDLFFLREGTRIGFMRFQLGRIYNAHDNEIRHAYDNVWLQQRFAGFSQPFYIREPSDSTNIIRIETEKKSTSNKRERS